MSGGLKGEKNCFLDPGGSCDNPTSLSIPPTRFQTIDIGGRNVRSLDIGFATPTPEPATLLLFGTTAAGLALVRWKRRQKS
jgi:hypothetical protein